MKCICLLNLLFFTMTGSQTFHQFGLYEYYWSTEINGDVESYSEAEEQCRQMNATLAIVNRRDIGVYFDIEIPTIPCKQVIQVY